MRLVHKNPVVAEAVPVVGADFPADAEDVDATSCVSTLRREIRL